MTSTSEKGQFRIMTWNLGFGSNKPTFISNDFERAREIYNFVNKHDVDAIALQEMANIRYLDGSEPLNIVDYFNQIDSKLGKIYFEPAVRLGDSNSFPYGKLRELREEFGILSLERGLGIWIRNVNSWYLCNLYSNEDTYSASIEAQRPVGHPLYMVANQPSETGGRDEEDRPVLWSRISSPESAVSQHKIFILSLHLPTLRGEGERRISGDLSVTQQYIAQHVLRLSSNRIISCTVDELGSELRKHYLSSVLIQSKRIEEYWNNEDNECKCVFVLAGDFNFMHSNKTIPGEPEQTVLENEGFTRAKCDGYTRDDLKSLVDNIWVKGANQVEESKVDNSELPLLKSISDHYPVIADIFL